MVNKSTINQISHTGEKYINTYNNLVKDSWQNHCGCIEPGLLAKCITCPFAIEFIQKIQQEIDPDSKLGMTTISPLQVSPPYSEEIKQRCVSMYELGYSLRQIKDLTGAGNSVILRRWFKKSGICKGAEEYSQKQQQQCLNLYLEGKTPLEIEEETKISGDLIYRWIYSSGIPIRHKKIQYSDDQQKLAISMYVEGKSYSKIESATGVHRHRVEELAKLQKVHRQKKPLAGRPPVYSEQFKQTCLDLLALGKTPIQIEQLMEVSASHIRSWQRKNTK